MKVLFRILGVLPALVIAGCVTSKTSLLSADSRVLPFLPGTQFEVYEREEPREPWRKNDRLATFLADNALVVREGDEQGEVKDESTYTFHSVGFERFLVQARFKHETRYSYGVLEIRNGEALVTGLNCKILDQDAFRRAGGTVASDMCELDGAADPVAVLRSLAGSPKGPQVRYVPVKK